MLVLLRHGETELTGEKRFSGSGAALAGSTGGALPASATSRSGGSGGSDGPGPDLSGKGVWQAGRAARELALRGGVQAVVSSPLARCRRTAEAVAARLGLDVVIDEGLRETDFGAWEGLTFAEARARHPAEMDAWLGRESAPPPGGESFAEVARRVTACRDALLTAYRGRTVLLVSHVTPIKTLLRLALGAPHAALFRMDLSPASLSEIAYYGDGNASVRHLNVTTHLR